MKNIKIIVLLLLSIISICQLKAQIKGITSLQEQSVLGSESSGMSEMKELLGGESAVLGNIVDANYYKVGPGDVLMLQNLTSFPEQSPIVVTPENTVIIPRVGIISLSNMTLAAARNEIIKAIKAKNRDAIASVTLYKPRNVIVTIEGDVSFPGTYVFPATFRISTAIRSANQTKLSQQLPAEQTHRILVQRDDIRKKWLNTQNSGLTEEIIYSTRDIDILRSDGSTVSADIQKAYSRASVEFDPYLQEGDVITVPFRPQNFSFIEINGAVRRPCKILFRQGDMVSDLLRFALGAASDADLSNITLFIPEKNFKTKINVTNGFEINGQDYELSSGSIIIVGKIAAPRQSDIGFVAIAGEVANPGSYNIQLGVTRLKDILKSAGGLTEKAYLPLAKIIRYGKHFPETEDKTKDFFSYMQYSDLEPLDTIRTKIDILMKEPVVSADFQAAIEKDSPQDTVLLEDGDLIVIPAKPTHIFVWGQVNKPGYIEFQEGKTIEWYIEQAGGAATGSDEDRARIIRGKNKIWVEGDDDIFVLAGDEVYVPHEIIPDRMETIQKYAAVASILGALAAVLNVIVWIYLR